MQTRRSILSSLACIFLTGVLTSGCSSKNGAADAGADLAPTKLGCEPGAKPGSPTGTETFQTANGTVIFVRTPATYDPLVASPLIVVFSAANKNSQDTEDATALTAPATARGYVIAYVDHLSPGGSADTQEAAAAAKAVQDNWCTDPNRFYIAGHSDGGTMTMLVTLKGLLEPTAIAPSASGFSKDVLASTQCPKRLVPMFEMHSQDDKLFPVADGFGPEVAAWFAQCASCGTPSAMDADGCLSYSGCTTEVNFCLGSGSHGKWPQIRDTAVLDFFDRIHP